LLGEDIVFSREDIDTNTIPDVGSPLSQHPSLLGAKNQLDRERMIRALFSAQFFQAGIFINNI